MTTAPRHLERTQRYLKLARHNIADAQTDRAADALRRAVTHAASAVMAAENRPTRTRRRLRNALGELVFAGRIPHAHLSTFRRIHLLPTRLPDLNPPEARRLLRTIRARAVRLVRDVSAILAANAVPRPEPNLTDPGLLCDLPDLYEMHATVPARCNNLSLPPNSPADARLAYNPSVCPGCANLRRPSTSRNLPLPTPTA